MNVPRPKNLLPGVAILCLAAVPARAQTPETPAPDGEPPEIKIGSKAFTESVILGEMMVHLVRQAGARTVHLAELGGTQILFKALQAGEIDAYPEYTGTITQELLAGQGLRDEAEIRKALAERGIAMSRRLGFYNTYALGMREDRARELGIAKISDLARHPELKLGLSDEFMERGDGWPGLQRFYDLPQKNLRSLEHNVAYRGLAEASLDVSDLYSTDAEIAYYHLRALEDDRGYFPLYHAVILCRADLQSKAPRVAEALRRLEGEIDTDTMSELNARARLDRVPESRVAAEFLNSRLRAEIALPEESRLDFYGRRLERLWVNTWEHLFLVAVSLAAAIAVAVPLGIVAHKRPKLGQGILSVVGVIQTLPSLALLVFMIPLLGLGAWPAITALFLYSLLPIVRNTYTGLHEIPPSTRESALALGLPPLARLWLVELPIASRSILAGIKTAAVINVGTATIGALIGAGGYGQPILTGIRLDDVGLILQGAVPAALLAILVQGLFGLAERFLVSQGLRKAA